MFAVVRTSYALSVEAFVTCPNMTMFIFNSAAATMGVLGLATLLLAADHLLLAGASEALHQHICEPVESLAARLSAEAYSRHQV